MFAVAAASFVFSQVTAQQAFQIWLAVALGPPVLVLALSGLAIAMTRGKGRWLVALVALASLPLSAAWVMISDSIVRVLI